MIKFLVTCVAICWSTIGLANPDAGYPKSCEVHPDRTVTFRFIAKDAMSVEVRGSFDADQKQLTKNEQGLWELTIGPLQPDLYDYTFRVDGAVALDPHNRWVKGWRRSANLFMVPGSPSMTWEAQAVPHGALHRHLIASKVTKAEREVFVYTPPGYATSNKKYPVLFLLHGSGDDPSAWTNVGRAHYIADNLIASGKMLPMVIVMPYGHVSLSKADESLDKDAWWSKHDAAVDRSFIEDVLPFAGNKYRIKSGPSQRAVAGLSMGGGQALRYGLNHPQQFGWVLAFSSGTPTTQLGIDEDFGDAPRDANRQLLWIGCGESDRLLDRNKLFCKWLDETRIRYEWQLTSGGHSWPVWRGYLQKTLPLLFQPKTPK